DLAIRAHAAGTAVERNVARAMTISSPLGEDFSVICAFSCLASAATSTVPRPLEVACSALGRLPVPLSDTVRFQSDRAISNFTSMAAADCFSRNAYLIALMISSVTIRPMLTASLDAGAELGQIGPHLYVLDALRRLQMALYRRHRHHSLVRGAQFVLGFLRRDRAGF